MALADRIAAATRFDPTRFIPFVLESSALGYVRRDFADHLLRYGDVLDVADDRVSLRASLTDYPSRSGAMASVARSLAERGLLSKWREELYEIGPPDGRAPSFVLERAAVRFFGFTASAVHLNGLVRDSAGVRMWIATRSADKAIDPGMFDNLVGGGIARGLCAEQTLVKEAWEEAGIDAALASQAQRVGKLRVCREVPDGLHSEVIHVYDLTLPAQFHPTNQDGEVAQFRCCSLQQVAAELAAEAPYTVDAGLVALDCLCRCMPQIGNRLSNPD